MSGMEPEVKDFLKKVLQSVFIGLLWMIVNMTTGIFFGLLFINDKISIGNIIYYLFLVISLAGLIWFYYRTWKNKFPHG
jgi:hypothetical protein